jgi:membrane protein implicated in regulation of membrane protease activity
VLALYLGALVVGVSVLGVQAFAGHDADGGGHDASHGDHDAPPWALLLSLRFWSFGFLAFGLAGTLLTFFGLAGVTVALVVSSVLGLGAGAGATTVIRRMTHKGPSSQVLPAEVVGKIGRVLVPADAASRGKVRVELRGQIVDYVAASREPLAENDVVVIEEFDGSEVTVTKAPKELEP